MFQMKILWLIAINWIGSQGYGKIYIMIQKNEMALIGDNDDSTLWLINQLEPSHLFL